MVVLDGNSTLWALNGLPLNTYISMYARKNRCYKERGSRTNYVRSRITHCILNLNLEAECTSETAVYYTVQKIQKTIIQMCRSFHWAQKFLNSDLHDKCVKGRPCYARV